MKRLFTIAQALFFGHAALAEDGDAAALLLADEAPQVAQEARDWRIFAEGAVGGLVRRSDGASRDTRRLSLDIQYDHAFSPGWRAFLANRLDTGWPVLGSGDNSINTLKEAYVSWRLQPETLAELGRINVRNGVAMGYNPTDYFRSGALRSVVSLDPASLKENRQGSVMVRGQHLWEGGSVTALYSPELDRRPNPEGFNPDAGATNGRHRGLVAVSQRMFATFTPQLLAYREEGLPTQFGLNLTGLVNDRTVAYLEWSGGRSPSQLSQALEPVIPVSAGNTWRNRLASGLTYTTANKISLTAEYHYNGGGLDEAGWNGLRRGPLSFYGLYRKRVLSAQELPTRQALLFYGQWQDALVNHLDLSAMVNYDMGDSSRRIWLEARYRLERVEYGVQWQRNVGGALSDYGAAPEARGWVGVVRYYF